MRINRNHFWELPPLQLRLLSPNWKKFPLYKGSAQPTGQLIKHFLKPYSCLTTCEILKHHPKCKNILNRITIYEIQK